MILRFLIGPTAVGKTALGIDWARANNAEILCADAPLVYRGMNLGTAKPTAQEQEQVPHHGIDLVEVTQKFSVADYLAYAAQVVAKVERKSKNLLVVGGSGFYLKSFFEPVTDGIEISPQVTEEVARIFELRGLDGLIDQLQRVGGSQLGELDQKNPRRVIKALERCLASGKSYSEVVKIYREQPLPYAGYSKQVIMLWRDKEDLSVRIRKRAERMLQEGLIEEVTQLRKKGLEKNPTAASVIGYRESLAYLDGKMTLEQLREMLVQNTLQLARKQRTFFKQLPVDETWMAGPGETPSAEAIFV